MIFLPGELYSNQSVSPFEDSDNSFHGMTNQSQMPLMTVSQSALETAEETLDNIEGIYVYLYLLNKKLLL